MPIWSQGFERVHLNNGAPFNSHFASFGDEGNHMTFCTVSLLLAMTRLLLGQASFHLSDQDGHIFCKKEEKKGVSHQVSKKILN